MPQLPFDLATVDWTTVAIFSGIAFLAALVGNAIAIGIGVFVHIGNAVHHRAVVERQYADGNIQRVGKYSEFIGLSILVCVFQYGEFIFSFTGCSGKGVFE